MTPRECKAARALLGWTQFRLAQESRAGTATVADYERGARYTKYSTIALLQKVLEEAGVVFVPGGCCIRIDGAVNAG
jgi:transcriptional regulator with XRE-family HTH domain